MICGTVIYFYFWNKVLDYFTCVMGGLTYLLLKSAIVWPLIVSKVAKMYSDCFSLLLCGCWGVTKWFLIGQVLMPLFTLHTNLVCFSNLIFRLIDDMVILQVKSCFLSQCRAGWYGPNYYPFFFFYQSISIIIMINVKSLFLSSLKPEFCSKVKVVETRPLIFLNTINI